jgi:UDP:flavonoid glycosyltransferase YjiC (YdhE family)
VIWRYYAREALAALGAIADAIAARPRVRALLSLGGAEVDARALGRPNVAVARYVDQRRVLREADVFVTHHGLNSTHEAIFREVPMLSYPFFWDQPDLARKCQAFGLAVALADAPRAPLRSGNAGAALDGVLGSRASFRTALATARGWELDVMANRSSVLRRIAAL